MAAPPSSRDIYGLRLLVTRRSNWLVPQMSPLGIASFELPEKTAKVLGAVTDEPRYPDEPRTAPFSMPATQCRNVHVQHPRCGLLVDNKGFSFLWLCFHGHSFA